MNNTIPFSQLQFGSPIFSLNNVNDEPTLIDEGTVSDLVAGDLKIFLDDMEKPDPVKAFAELIQVSNECNVPLIFLTIKKGKIVLVTE